jgi:hypothetical protein
MDDLMKQNVDDEEDRTLFNFSLFKYRNKLSDKDRETLN